MRKFVLKLTLLLVPLLTLSLNYMGYEKSGGDLNRIGKISIDKDYRSIFSREFSREKRFLELSEIPSGSPVDFDVLTIGDSFSQQGVAGYQNVLASRYGFKVLNIDANAYHLDNPLQDLSSIANGSFFETIRPRFVILESIERRFSLRAITIDQSDAVDFDGFVAEYRRDRPVEEGAEPRLGLGIFSDIFKYFLYNVLYEFDANAFFSQVYDMPLTDDLFSARPNRLSFFHEDVDNIRFGEERYVALLNEELNHLSATLRAKGIILIVLPSPDKYDVYGEFIAGNPLPENRFFENMAKSDRGYHYIDAKAIFLPYLRTGVKDLYFADDTHWSPIASEIIAGEAAAIMGREAR